MMRKAIIALASLVVLLLGVWALWPVGNTDSGEAASASGTRARATPASAPYAVQEQAKVATSSAPVEQPRLKRPKVTFDRGPRQPDESIARYQDRVYFIEHFDRFVEESGISDEQVQQLLLGLYDYQEADEVLNRDLTRAIVRDELAQNDDSYLVLVNETFLNLQKIIFRTLSYRERQYWKKHCALCPSRISTFAYDILELEGEPQHAAPPSGDREASLR